MDHARNGDEHTPGYGSNDALDLQAMKTLLLVPVFCFSLWLPQIEAALASEPSQDCDELCILDLLGQAYEQGKQDAAWRCKLPDGPRVSRTKGINL